MNAVSLPPDERLAQPRRFIASGVIMIALSVGIAEASAQTAQPVQPSQACIEAFGSEIMALIQLAHPELMASYNGSLCDDMNRNKQAVTQARVAAQAAQRDLNNSLAALGSITADPRRLPPRGTKVSVYVGPTTRNGFVDVDQGINDSINDLRDQLRGHEELKLASRLEEADVVLSVIGRGTTGARSGAVATTIGASTFVSSTRESALLTILSVGPFEKRISFSPCDRRWRRCAGSIIDDVLAWVNANRPDK